MALRPPSVSQAAPSGPWMTPCGAEPLPSGTCRTAPVAGSMTPSAPEPCAEYQILPSGAGATSWGPAPSGSWKTFTSSAAAAPATSVAARTRIRVIVASMAVLRTYPIQAVSWRDSCPRASGSRQTDVPGLAWSTFAAAPPKPAQPSAGSSRLSVRPAHDALVEILLSALLLALLAASVPGRPARPDGSSDPRPDVPYAGMRGYGVRPIFEG